MKAKYICGLIMLVCLAFGLDGFGQQAERVIKLKLTDPETKASQTYLLNNAVYSFSKSHDSNSTKNPGMCSVNIDFKQDMDAFLLKWVAGEIKETEGVITLESMGIGKKARTISFTGGTSGNTAESFMAGDMSSYIQMALYVKTLTIDGITVYTEPKK